MHTRVTRQTNKNGEKREYLQLVESYRNEKGMSTKRVVATLGRLDQIRKGSLDAVVRGVAAYAETVKVTNLEEDLFAEDFVEVGLRTMVQAIWRKLGLKRILDDLEIPAEVQETIRLMVTARLDNPMSKRATHREADRWQHPDEDSRSLSSFYRAMDRILPHATAIEERLFEAEYGSRELQTDLFSKGDLDVVFFDTTSVKIKVTDLGDLFRRGYSKDHRPDLPQFLVGMVMTGDGNPIAHYVFPGNMADSAAFAHAVDDVTKRFPLRRVILVADRGCVGRNMLAAIRKSGREYVVAARMRTEKLVRDQVLSDRGRYADYDDVLSYKEVRVEGHPERFVVVRNGDLAAHEADRRADVLKRLEEMEGRSMKTLTKHRIYKRYLAKGGTISIDRARVKADARYDGKWVIRTNVSDMEPQDLIETYKALWQVESWFARLKNLVDIGPVRHFTENRVRAHVFLCFLSLRIWSYFNRALQAQDKPISPTDSWAAVKRIRGVELRCEDTRLLIRNEPDPLAIQAFKALRTPLPKRVEVLPSDL